MYVGLGETPLGRLLGVVYGVGSLMSYWMLPQSGMTEARITEQRLMVLE